MARDAVDVLQPDVARAGGISEVRTIAAAAAERGLPISLHTYGDGIALAASLHLAAALDNSSVMEFDYNENPLRSDLLRERLEPDNGFMRPARRPRPRRHPGSRSAPTLPLRRRWRPRAMASDLARRWLVPESFRRGYENGGALQRYGRALKISRRTRHIWRHTRNMIPRPESGSTPNPAPRPQSVIPAKQAVSKRHPSEAQTPEIVIPAKAGIQEGWGGETPL